nr:LytTR family DNA-binding domain-containing protein [Tellurirhabdus rosea]
MVEHTLDQLSQMLSEAEFYRINRQMIANIEAIRQVQQKEQGGFVLRLTPQFADEVTVSKKKAAEFKAWIDR